MEQHEQELFDQLYAKHLQGLKLQGKRSKTIDGYARAVRRVAGFFNRCPDNLSATELKAYFAWMVRTTPGAASRWICGDCPSSIGMCWASRWIVWTSSSHPNLDRCQIFPHEKKCSS
ncbi:MAG: phage integrase N-terminal SAM-like domain-containing protein [Cyanobacteriota bacterium]